MYWIINQADIILPQTSVTLTYLGYPFWALLVYLLPETFRLFGFPVFFIYGRAYWMLFKGSVVHT
jgi:hypothetical protein